MVYGFICLCANVRICGRTSKQPSENCDIIKLGFYITSTNDVLAPSKQTKRDTAFAKLLLNMIGMAASRALCNLLASSAVGGLASTATSDRWARSHRIADNCALRAI